jgi:ABC-type phosphate transport system substrate-binding protein
MVTKGARRIFLYGVSACYFTLLLLPAISVHAEHINLNGLAGPPFINPSQVMDMPDDWINQPIKYDPSAGEADVVVTLDQHLYPALLPLIQKYEKEYKMKIIVNEGTCGISAGLLSRKAADISGYCCPPGLTDRLPGLEFHTLGISALALLVHSDNTIDNITFEQAQQIFTGKIYKWSELKTSDGKRGATIPVHPIGRLHCKLRPGHWRLLIDNQDMFSTSLQEVGAIPDMIYKVASNQGAIGYEVLWHLIRYKQRGKANALRINGFNPENQEHIISGKYPLYRVYNLTTWEGKHTANPVAQKLVEYLLQQCKHMDTEHGIIPASRLRQAGWKFKGNELIGEPK